MAYNFIQTNTKALESDLKKLKANIVKKSSVDSFTQVYLQHDESRGGLLTMLGSDADCATTLFTEIKSEHPEPGLAPNFTKNGKLAVNFHALLDAVKQFKNAQCEISLHSDYVYFNCGSAKIRLPALQVRDWADQALLQSFVKDGVPVPHLHKLKFAGEFLSDALSKAKRSMPESDIRYYLNGVYFDVVDTYFNIVCTDGHRMTYIKQDSNGFVEPGVKTSFVVPYRTANHVSDLIKKNKTREVIFEVFERHICIRLSGGIQIHSKLVEGRYPDYNRVIPKTNQHNIECNREDFINALKPCTNKAINENKYLACLIEIKDGKITISARAGGYSTSIDYGGYSQNITIGFNTKYLIDALETFDSRSINIALHDDKSSILIQETKYSDSGVVIMPMKI